MTLTRPDGRGRFGDFGGQLVERPLIGAFAPIAEDVAGLFEYGQKAQNNVQLLPSDLWNFFSVHKALLWKKWKCGENDNHG